MSQQDLESLRSQIDSLNLEILRLINERAEVVEEIGKIKEKQGVLRYDPLRERHMLDLLKANNNGPLNQMTVDYIFKQIFKTALKQLEAEKKKELLVSRKEKSEDTVININGELIGAGGPSFVFGPCAVESYEQVAAVAQSIKDKGLKIIRGGAYKPRTSPYDFQGLGLEGLKILKQVSQEYGLATITEIVTPADLDVALDYIDVVQIGARNMQNFELLKAVGATNKPVLLKRGMAATIDEFIHAAEYIMSKGNENIILCERGIRTFEHYTRNTLDLSAVLAAKKLTHLPVIVDPSHAAGMWWMVEPLAKAAIAVGADGLIIEVHNDPEHAKCDGAQSLKPDRFSKLMTDLRGIAQIVGREL